MTDDEAQYRQRIDEKLDMILEQTRKTNGRVTSIETRLTAYDLWRAKMEGVALPFKLGWAVVISLFSGGLAYLFIKTKA